MNSRNGKIARLPREIRDELNERLDCSEESPQLLPWLNALPEVKEVVQKNFGGVPISKQNLSQWRQGGFQEWLARRDLCAEASEVAECAYEMDEGADGVLADAAATVLAARFGSLILHWDGEVDEKFEAKSRVLNRLCRSVVQLQREMHRSDREKFELQQMQAEKEKAEEEVLQRKLVTPFFDALKVEPVAKLFGGGTAGRKIAEFILAIQRGKLNTKFDVLPTDKFGDEEPAAKEEKTVKPTRKRRTVQRARKTKPVNADKPLEANEMESGKEAGTSRGESESVKVNQTDLSESQMNTSLFQ